MSEDKGKKIEASVTDSIVMDDKAEFSFPTDVSSKAIVNASVEVVPMNENEQKFFQETIESYDKYKVTEFEICILGFKIGIKRTPQEKKILTIQRYKEE